MSKFTEGAMATDGKPGSTYAVKTSSMPGGTINVAYGMDNVHGVSLPNTMGKELAKSCTDLSHSLSGASAVQRTTRSRG
jgi:hypothetical protein